ncbi:MAG: DUF5683 domain-containing protein [Bacteroides sp.]
MTKASSNYKPYLIALLCCLLQLAGMDTFAQNPQARARRHREIKKEQLSDSLQTDRTVQQPTDSAAGINTAVVDSLERVNKTNLRKMEATTPTPPASLPKDSMAPDAAKKLWVPNSGKATWLAVIFPGGGQIYNRKFWKLPIIYGGFAGCAYALSWNGKMYKDYSQAYQDIMDSNPNTNSFEDLLPPNYSIDKSRLTDLLRRRKDTFRRYRDLSIFAFIGVYLISIVDAYVDAELSNFDITPDLSMRVEPALMSDPIRHGTKSVGVQCSFRF